MKIGSRIMDAVAGFFKALFDVWNSASGQGR